MINNLSTSLDQKQTDSKFLQIKKQSKFRLSQGYSFEQNDTVYQLPQPKITHHQSQSPNKLNQQKKKTKLSIDKQLFIASLKQSYKILGDQKLFSPKKDKKNNVSVSKQADDKKQITETNNIVETLKAPLNINIQRLSHKKTIKLDELNSQILIKDQNRRWSKIPLEIDLNSETLKGFDLDISLKNINKIKIFKPDYKKELYQIKISYQEDKGNKKQQQFFVINVKSDQIQKITSQFMIFAQLITQKLKTQKSYKQTKWQKTIPPCEQIIYGSFIFGDIHKKSQHFKKWQKRFIMINNKGIFSYKNGDKKDNFTFCIERQLIEEIWTRFEIINENLIVKIKHGVKKTQIGIPIMNFTQANHKNWLYFLYKLMTVKN